MRQIIQLPRNAGEKEIADIVNSRVYAHNNYEGFFIKEEVIQHGKIPEITEEAFDVTYLIFDSPANLN